MFLVNHSCESQQDGVSASPRPRQRPLRRSGAYKSFIVPTIKTPHPGVSGLKDTLRLNVGSNLSFDKKSGFSSSTLLRSVNKITGGLL